jgi:hypothetical protein
MAIGFMAWKKGKESTDIMLKRRFFSSKNVVHLICLRIYRINGICYKEHYILQFME